MAIKGRNGRAMSIPLGTGWGIAAALTVTLAAACVYAWLIGKGSAAVSTLGYVCMGIQFAAALVGSVLGWMLVKHNRLAVTGIICGGYFILLLVLALAFGGGFEGVVTTAAMIGLGGVIWQIPWLFGSRSGGRRVRKRVFR